MAKPKSGTAIAERKPYRVDGGRILVFGDLHLSAKYEGTHKNYIYECYYNMDKITSICEESKPSAIFFLGDIIGVNERKISDHQFLMRVMMFFMKLNTITNGNVYSVKGNHDIGDFSDFDMWIGIGLLKNPKYVDYYGNGKLEIRFHFVNYGEERYSLDITEYPVVASNVVLGHADYYIEGVTNWYSAKQGVHLNELDNFCGVEMVISGHIHVPSDGEISYTTLKDGSTIGLFYVGSPSRVVERIDDCWYMWFEYADGETNYEANLFGLEPASEVFFPKEDLIEEMSEEDAERVYQSEKLTEYVKEIMESRLTSGDLFGQIDLVPGVSKEIKNIAKGYLQRAINEGGN